MPGNQGSQSLRANALFKNALCPARMHALARKERFIERQRIADAASLFWALIATLGGSSAQYLSDVLRNLNGQQGWALRYKPFWNRLAKPAFARFMRAMFQRLCSELVARMARRQLKSVAAHFSDIFIDDGTSFGLSDGLKTIFPGRYTKGRPAAVELHAHMSLFKDQMISVKLAPDTHGERQFVPRAKELPRLSLTLRDRGYVDLDYFDALQDTEAFLICRACCNINPVVVEMRGVPRSLAVRHRGKRLADVPRAHLKAASDLKVAFSRKNGETVELRLVVRELPRTKPRAPRHPRKKKPPTPRTSWQYLLTNLPDHISGDDVQSLYRLRWQIELVFKDWKSYANLHLFQTENPAIAEGMIWASLCAAFIKRALAHWAQLVYRKPVSTRAAAQAGSFIMHSLVSWWSNGARVEDLLRLLSYLAHTALRAYPQRDRLRPQEALGLHFAFS